MTNRLYYGDNLDVLRDHIPDESVDLIYLDPPFDIRPKLPPLVSVNRKTAPVETRVTHRPGAQGGLEL